MTQTTIVCQRCNTANGEKARFCSGCGNPLPVTEQSQPVEMFLSYSHEDEDLKKLFVKHMAPLRRANLALIWYDRDIRASEDWRNEINTHLTSAKIILLLVSASFIESDYCYCNEMRVALERHKRGEAKVVPIIVRPAAWENTPLHALQAIPRNAKPVEMWSNKDEAWLNVVQEIRRLILPQK